VASPDIPSVGLQSASPVIPSVVTQSASPVVPSVVSQSAGPAIPASVVFQSANPVIPSVVTQSESPVIPSVVSQSASPVIPSAVSQSASPVIPSVVSQSASPVIPSVVSQSASPVIPSVVSQSASPAIPSVVSQSASPVIPSIVTQSASPVSQSVVTQSASPVIPPVVASPILPPNRSMISLVDSCVSSDDYSTVASVLIPGSSPNLACHPSTLSSCACPLCTKKFSSLSNLWQHINSVHISRCLFPGVATFESGNRLVCSEPSCRWASHSRFKSSGCRRLISSDVRCGAPLVEANSIAEIPQVTNLVITSSNPPSFTESTFSNGPLDIGLLSACACKYLGPPAMESEVLNVLLDHVMVCPVSTISHVPRSVQPLLAHVLSIEFQKACSSVWGFVRLFLFAKVVLRTPGGQSNHRRRFVISSVLLDRLHMWSLSDGIKSLWSLLQDDLKVSKPKQSASSDDFSKSHALFWAREGRYSNALQSLNSVGVAGYDDDGTYQDLLKRHPYSSCPIDSSSDPSSLTVDGLSGAIPNQLSFTLVIDGFWLLPG